MTALSFFGGPGSLVGNDKVCVVSADWEGITRVIVFNSSELNNNASIASSLNRRGGGNEVYGDGGRCMKMDSFTMNDWAFSKRINAIAVDWMRGTMVGCSERSELKLLDVTEDGHLNVVQNLRMDYARSGRHLPKPKCLAVAHQDGRIVVGDHKGYISMVDPRDCNKGSLMFAKIEAADHKRSIEVTDVSTTLGNSNLLAAACWRGPIRLFDMRMPEEVMLEYDTAIDTSAKLSPHGDRIASLSRDNYIRVWNLRHGRFDLEAKIQHCWNEGHIPLMRPFLISIRPVWITNDLFMIIRYDSTFAPGKFTKAKGKRGSCCPIAIYDVNENRQVASIMSPRVRRVSYTLDLHPEKECLASAAVDETIWTPDFMACGHVAEESREERMDEFRKRKVLEMLAVHEGLRLEGKSRRKKKIDLEIENLKGKAPKSIDMEEEM